MPDRYRTGRVLVERQRDACCEVLHAVTPHAPTLCEGWTAFDLAAHLDALCRDPLSLPGIELRPLEGLARVRARRLQARLGYAGLVRRLHTGSPWIPAFGIDPWQGWGHHLGEWFVHTPRTSGAPTISRRRASRPTSTRRCGGASRRRPGC